MKHISNEAWIDFIRDLTPSREKAIMESHLSTGCKACAASLEGWRKVLAFTEKEAGHRVPETALKTVQGTFGIYKASPTATHAALQFARLIFDSARQPLPAGVRGGLLSSRQYLFATKEFTVDMQEVSLAGSSRCLLMGQVTNSARPSDFASGKQVLLTSGKNLVAETLTNQYGEFHLELDEPTEEPLTVSIAVDAETDLVAPLIAYQSERAPSAQGERKARA